MSESITLDASWAIEALQRTLTGFAQDLSIALNDAKSEQPTLRDRFAMSALQGLLAAESAEQGSHYDDFKGKTREQHAAADAYALADAMLEARKPAEPKPEVTP